MILTTILLQAAGGGGGGMSMMILMGAMFVVMYFFMIRPQQKRQKEATKFRESLKKGDMVVTIGGLHGKVVEIDTDTLTLEVDRGVRMKFEKSAVSQETSKKYATQTTAVATEAK